MCAVPTTTVFCSLLAWFLLFLNDFEMFPVVPIITGTIFVFYITHMLCCCCCCCCCCCRRSRRRRHHHHHHHHLRHLWRIIKGKGLTKLKRKTWRGETRIARIWLPFSLRFTEKKKGRKTLQKQLRKVDVLSFISPTKCTMLIIYVHMLKAYLRHVPVQVFHLQGAPCTRFKTSFQWYFVIYKIL